MQDRFPSTDLFSHSDFRIQSLETSNEILKEKCKELSGTIEEQGNNIQNQTTKIKSQLDTHGYDLLLHESMLERLMDTEEEGDEDEDEDGSDQDAGKNQDDEDWISKDDARYHSW